ncbi:MAG: penicillin-binding protein 2 [Deltaproteobacteria bacterium]|nr:penicillin-binding protein 2 [Deltaproteobacteria bacterium]
MSVLVSRSDMGEFRKRPRWLALVVVLCFLVLTVRVFYMQAINSDEYRALARENIIRRVTLATTRGVVRDKLGRVLAANRPSYNVYCVPSKLDMKDVWPRLVGYMLMSPLDRDKIQKRIMDLRNDPGPRKDWQILVKEDISRDLVATLATHAAELPGIDVVPTPVRYYPHHELGAHVLGYMAEVDSDALVRLRALGYMEGDRRGSAGVERGWESYLRGTRGWEKVVVDSRSRRHIDPESQTLIDDPKRLDPIPGRDLRLTIDLDIQKAISSAMKGQLAGSTVVVEVRTGRVLGMISKPSYDPNDLSGGNGVASLRAAYRRINSDPLQPSLDKTMSGAYPPGSTIKPFSAIAALREHLIDVKKQVDCRGFYQFGKRMFKCTHVHGPVDLNQAIVRSCNVYFYQLGEAVGLDRLAKVGLDFGFGQKTGLGTNVESPGRMPTRGWYSQHYKGQFRVGFTLNAAIGQGATTVTALQLALSYAALANGGTLYEPQLVHAVETADGTIVQDLSPRVRRRVNVRPEDLTFIAKALWGVVNDDRGTAYKERLADVDAAGKTGTAQVSHQSIGAGDETRIWYFNRDHAWFAAYAPTSSPEIAVIVLIEHGGAGGRHAAPVAFQVMRAYNRLKAERAAKKSAAPASSEPEPPPTRGDP